MKMTKGEIIQAYKDRPNAKRIQEIADENNVTANEIRKILKAGGEDVAVFDTGRGPGRPPKKTATEETASGILKEVDKTLSDKEEKAENKSDSLPCEMLFKAPPKSVLNLCHERILNINRQIQVYVEQVDLLNTERNELLEFIEKKGEA